LVEGLWNFIASDSEEVEVPDHHKSVLEQRLKILEKDKTNGSSWKQIRQKYQ